TTLFTQAMQMEILKLPRAGKEVTVYRSTAPNFEIYTFTIDTPKYTKEIYMQRVIPPRGPEKYSCSGTKIQMPSESKKYKKLDDAASKIKFNEIKKRWFAAKAA